MGFSIGPIGHLVLATVACILQSVFVCLIGYLMANVGVLDKRMQGKLNKLNVSVFTPALLFSKVAFYLTPERLSELAIVPIGFVCVTFMSAVASVLTSRLLRVLPSQRPFVTACAITPNSNTLPVALISSLVYSVPELHWVQDGEDSDRPELMLGRALTYLVMFSTFGTIQRWSIAAKLMALVKMVHPQGLVMGNHGYAENDGEESSRSGFRDDVTDWLVDQGHRSQWAEQNSIFHHTPMAGSSERAGLLSEEPDDIGTRHRPLMSHVSWSTIWQKYVLEPWRAFLDFMTVPLWTSLLSFVVVLIPPLQRVIVSFDSVTGAVEQLGQCSIPMSILVLGAYFSGSDAPGTDLVNRNSIIEEPMSEAQRKEIESWEKRVTWRTIVATCAARMIVAPLIILPAVAFLCLTNDSKIVDDPVFIACACLLIGSPPALTLAQISRQRGDPNGNLEALISGTIFVSYVFLTAPVTVLLVFVALYLDKMQARFV